MPLKITFLGGEDEIGASGTLLEIAGQRILVDYGIRPSLRAWERGGSRGSLSELRFFYLASATFLS